MVQVKADPDTSNQSGGSGNRERNKRAKLLRIRQAARKIFLARGFERATVREISSEAKVALGTLFLYAQDKQDILLLIFEEDLPEVRAATLAKVDEKAPLIQQLMTFFDALYHYFGSTPQLSADMLREIMFGKGMVAQRLANDIAETQRDVARIIARAQAAGSVSETVDPDLAAHVIFSIHRVEIRNCLNQDAPDLEASVANLRKQIELVLKGLEKRADG